MKVIHFRIVVRSKGGKEERGLLRTACGRYGTGHLAAYDPRDVDCFSCKKTKKYKISKGVR